ncbi:hypothetical protein [Candidatus Thioglobus sp.]|jgi:hypothetical protein|uniref:hypothetical protein n=1 Tax=Candidatus Thioglobus sp. TaxID=2026721 RepID=UPI0032426828
MQTMTKILFSSVLLLSSVASASLWMPWEDNGNNNGNNNVIESWMPWNSDSNSNFSPMNSGNNWGPFNSGSNFGPMDSMTNWGPFNSDSNFGPMDGMTDWGPMETANNFMNDTEFGLTFKTKNKTDSKGYARADSKYSGELQNRISGKGDWYGDAQADNYYKGQINNYGQVRGEGRYYGYGRQGHLGYVPTQGNDFPAPGY